MELYRPTWAEASIERLYKQIARDLLDAPPVDTGHWQAKKDVPQTETKELTNVVIQLPISGSSGGWASYMRPNLPWAEDHFQERVSGRPYNPPPSHTDWPFNQAGNKDHMDGEKFSHTYPERIWPKWAGNFADRENPELGLAKAYGIRYDYGDLGDAVSLLHQEPHTRQCFIPIWFPEDLCAASVHHQRVPCTLGYHLMLRRNQLQCFYPMRSLDLLRYFKDDAYMAGRLVQWVIEELKAGDGENGIWQEVEPGMLTMHAVSLHVFEGDLPIIRHMLGKRVAA